MLEEKSKGEYCYVKTRIVPDLDPVFFLEDQDPGKTHPDSNPCLKVEKTKHEKKNENTVGPGSESMFEEGNYRYNFNIFC